MPKPLLYRVQLGRHPIGVQDRIRALNEQPVRENAQYVVYWAQMNRRVEANHGLAHAIDLANERRIPVLYYEGFTCTYDAANDRTHTFVLEGVPDTAAALEERGIGYLFYLRRRRSDANDVLYRVAKHAAAVVTDDYPTFINLHHNKTVPPKLDVPYLAVDSSCVVPMSRFPKREWAAYTLRPKLHRLLPQYLQPLAMPTPAVPYQGEADALQREFHVTVRDPEIPQLVASCEIDHGIRPSLVYRGGARQAAQELDLFLEHRFSRYASERNEPKARVTSNMSPYLHFGHISSLQLALRAREYAEAQGMTAEEYLEELLVRRELAFNFCRHTEKFYSLEALPDWAQRTLAKHDPDTRNPLYSREQMELAQTGDDIWNAAQTELLLTGKIHGYYRIYWGKKVLEWSPSHADALETLIDWHNRYALDGRDPNTYTNVLWLFGLHDRPWAERPIFGQVRYMSYDGMKRKTDAKAYLRQIEYLKQTGRYPDEA